MQVKEAEVVAERRSNSERKIIRANTASKATLRRGLGQQIIPSVFSFNLFVILHWFNNAVLWLVAPLPFNHWVSAISLDCRHLPAFQSFNQSTSDKHRQSVTVPKRILFPVANPCSRPHCIRVHYTYSIHIWFGTKLWRWHTACMFFGFDLQLVREMLCISNKRKPSQVQDMQNNRRVANEFNIVRFTVLRMRLG